MTGDWATNVPQTAIFGSAPFVREGYRGQRRARIAAAADPSSVLVSSTVKDLVAGSGLVSDDAGEHELKGIPDRWHLYRQVLG